MDIVLAVCGDIKVENDIHMWDIQASARHVRGQQDRSGLGLELVETGQPLVLRHLTVQRNRVEP